MNKITLGIGETKVVSLAGGRFYFEKGAGRISVKTIGNDSNVFTLSPGMGFQNRGVNFPSIEITNLHDVEQTIEFIVSYREVFDNRVTFGASGEDLQVQIKKSLLRTDRGQAFSFSVTATPHSVVETTYAAALLINQFSADPSKSCYVTKIRVSGTSSGLEVYLLGDPGVAELDWMGGDTVNVAVLKSGHNASFAVLETSVKAYAVRRALLPSRTVLEAAGGRRIANFLGPTPAQALRAHVFEFDNPVRLDPFANDDAGCCLLVRSLTSDTELDVDFEIVEFAEVDE
jgi:hypothetical protein